MATGSSLTQNYSRSQTTYDREKTQRLDTCEPETASVIRGVGKKQPPSRDYGVEGDSEENTKENCCVASTLINDMF
ncbi:hypothetical protein TNCV_67941 [Trichonephila clavipes]|nr:hypothetical protein TNCV_67941 [Trichonephila clavipes]